MFKVGDKIVCIDNYGMVEILNLYETYTVSALMNLTDNTGYALTEVPLNTAFRESRFISLDVFNLLKRKDKILKIKERINEKYK
jgi:hypothetical protein